MFTYCKNLGHQECVYNIIDTKDTAAPKIPLYKSRFADFVKNERICNQKGQYRTMGTPHLCLYPPQAFLKKHSRTPISVTPDIAKQLSGPPPECAPGPKECEDIGVPTQTDKSSTEVCVAKPPLFKPKAWKVNRFCRCCLRPQKPPITKASTMYKLLDRGEKDFLLDNALDVVRRPAKIAQTKIVDKHDGHQFEWCTSGFPRKYVCRKDYGMIPGYLVERKIELALAEQDKLCELDRPNREAQEKCRHLDDTERQAMINGLKTNWEEVYREFQAMPLMIDTPGKVQKKSELEDALRDIEKDIQLLERHNHIFVADSKKSFYLA